MVSEKTDLRYTCINTVAPTDMYHRLVSIFDQAIVYIFAW